MSVQAMTAATITEALCAGQWSMYSHTRWLAVPNVSHGWHLNYEADIIVVSKAMWAQEIEVKVDLGDLKADRLKQKHRPHPWGLDGRVRRFWYAVPSALKEAALDPANVAAEYGVIEVVEGDGRGSGPQVVRPAAVRREARKVTPEEYLHLCELAVMRYWNQRTALRRLAVEAHRRAGGGV